MAAQELAQPGKRLAVLGISVDQPCGVHDHASLLAEALADLGPISSMHWLSRSAGSIAAQRAEVREWLASSLERLEADPPDAVLLHYSVFAYAYRGVPVFARPVLATIARTGLPLVSFLHEFAYPWHMGGARGKIWSLTQRLALASVMRASSGVIVSADARAAWLAQRAWLAGRPTSVAAVFSNLPAPSPATAPVAGRLGLFGYGHEGVAFETVLDALSLLRQRRSDVELVLLGAPGSSSEASAHWRRAARERGLESALSFSGRLPAQALSDDLARCTALLFVERGGPTSRKTTLAASLSSGRPVVALDGRNSWPALLQARAALVVAPDPAALAGGVAGVLDDEHEGRLQAERGRTFAAQMMSVQHSATVVAAALAGAIADPR